MEHTEVVYHNLSVRNFHEQENDEYTMRIRAHAQVIVKRGGKVIPQQADVTPWEEY